MRVEFVPTSPTSCTLFHTVHKCAGPIAPPITSRSCSSLSDDAKRENFPFFIKLSVLAPFGTALLGLSHTRAGDRPRCWTWAVPGSGAAYDYRWLSVTCKRAWTNLWQPPQLVLSLDRDNHSCPFARLSLPIALSPFGIAFANFYVQRLGGSSLQQWDRNVLVSILMGNLSNLGFARRC